MAKANSISAAYAAAFGNLTLSPSSAGCSSGTVYTIGTGGNGTYYNTNGTNWATTTATNPYVTVGTSTSAALKVSGDADIQGNLKVNGVDIGNMLAKIQDRLAILVPDPARLDKYEALKQAYEHYKILEALCVEETDLGAKK
jgi:hypothetical protein